MESTAGAYLIVAKYNRSKWRSLNPDQKGEAHKTAGELFPDDKNSIPITDLAAQGVQKAQTFASDIFTKMSGNYVNLTNAEKDLFVDGIYATKPPTTPVGWAVIVDAASFLTYIERMCAHNSALWKMFDIEVYPLNNGWTNSVISEKAHPVNGDTTTQSIYDLMTPRNWT
jgi:hypothetical protein